MKKLFASLAAIGALLVVCGGAGPAAALETTKLVCAFTFWPGQGVYILADKLGYLKEEGIELEFVMEDDIQVQTEAMEAGHINCNSRTIGEYLSRPRNAETKGVVIGAMDFSRGGDGVIASGDIKDVCELKGKTFAMEPTLPANLLLQIELKEKCGLTLNDLDILHIATADGLAVFADPKVDVIESYEPLLSQILAANVRPGAYKLVDSADYPELIIDIFFLHDDLIEQNPELVRAMLRATYRAADFYFKDPDKANELMAPAFNLTPEEMAEAMKGLKFTTYEEALELFGTNEQPGRFKQVFETVMQLNIEQGVADAPLKYEERVDASMLVDLFEGHTR
jgi:NitT/TauT family transport system substrate-binding protein